MMVVPLICRMANKDKLPNKRGKRICLWNSVVLFVLSIVLLALVEISFIGGIGAVVFYFINKWVFVRQCDFEEGAKYNSENIPNDSVPTQEKEQPIRVSLSAEGDESQYRNFFDIYGSDVRLETANKTTESCLSSFGEEHPCNSHYPQNYEYELEARQSNVFSIPSKQKKGVSKPAFIVVSCVCAVAIVCSCVFGCLYRKNYNIGIQNYEIAESLKAENTELKKTVTEISELEAELSQLDSDNAKLRSTNEQLAERISELNESVAMNAEKAKICDDHLVFVPSGSNMYHKYDCEKWDGTCSIYASWQLDDMNLRACPYCH